MLINERALIELIDRALTEDIGSGDLTTESTVPDDMVAVGYIKAKQHGVVAGLPIARAVFKQLDPELQFLPQLPDGTRINPGDVLVATAEEVHSGRRTSN